MASPFRVPDMRLPNAEKIKKTVEMGLQIYLSTNLWNNRKLLNILTILKSIAKLIRLNGLKMWKTVRNWAVSKGTFVNDVLDNQLDNEE